MGSGGDTGARTASGDEMDEWPWSWDWEEDAEEEPLSDDPEIEIDPAGATLLAMLHQPKPQQRRYQSCLGRIEWQARETGR